MREVFIFKEDLEQSSVEYYCPYCSTEIIDCTQSLEDGDIQYCIQCSEEFRVIVE